MNKNPGQNFLRRPSTHLGWWAVGIALVNVVLYFIYAALLMSLTEAGPSDQTIQLVFSIFMITCSIGAGVVGSIALIRKKERSWMVWLAVIPGVFALLFIIGTFLLPL